MSYSGIAKATGVKRRTAIDIVHRAEERAQVGKKAGLKKLFDKKNVDALPKKPRSEAATAREKRYLIRTAEVPENRRSILKELVEKAELNICQETARKYLNEAGLHWRKPRRKPILTRIQKQNRLKWCLAHRNTDWSRWIFTDEISIVPGQVRGRNGVWRRVGEEYQGDKGTVDRKKKPGSSAMFWGAICYGIPGPGHVWTTETSKEKEIAAEILKTENKQQELAAKIALEATPPRLKKRDRPPTYLTEQKICKKGVKGIDWYRYRKEILRPHLYPFYQKVNSLRDGAVIMEDGAGPHSHHFLEEERDSAGVKQEEWPSSSPDLNAIEIVWDHMKDSIAARRPKITKIKALRSVLMEEWESVPQEKIDALIESMPARIAACIKDHGGNNFNF